MIRNIQPRLVRGTTAMANSQIVNDFLERVWNLGRIDECDLFVADEYDIRHDPGDPWDGRTLNREQFKERVRVSRAPCPDQRFTVIHAADGDDFVFVGWTWTGTHVGEISGMPATGRVLTMSGATVYFVTDGQVSGHWQVVDRLSVAKQLAAAA